jgi:hypothetical protein
MRGKNKAGLGVRSALALAFVTPALLMGTAAPALAYDIGLPTWLTSHPELTTKSLPVGAITGTAAEVAVPAAGGVGAAGAALALGAGVLAGAGTYYALDWAFGDDGDNRASLFHEGFALPGWFWDPGGCCNGPDVFVMPPAAQQQTNPPYTNRLINQSGLMRDLSFKVQCVAPLSGTVTVLSTATVLNVSSYVDMPALGCASGQVFHSVEIVDANVPTEVVFRWVYDPSPSPTWSTRVDLHCRNAATNATVVVTGTVVTTASAPGTNVSNPVPSCPGSYEPEVAALIGGRAGETGQLLYAVPVTRTATARDAGASPAPSPGPSVGPSQAPTPAPGAVPGTGTNPDPDSGPVGDPATDPKAGGKSCMGAAWSLNPVQWVFVPVKCALQWAFVPDTAALTEDVGGVRDAWNGSAPAVYIAGATVAVGAIGGIGAGVSGCAGPAVHILTVTVHPLSACDAPMSTVAAVIKTILTLGVLLGAATLCAVAVARSLGYDMPLRFGGGDKE